MIWTYGAGALVGYRFNIGNSFLIEPQLGFAFGKTSPVWPYNEKDYRFLHLARLELNIGYFISGN